MAKQAVAMQTIYTKRIINRCDRGLKCGRFAYEPVPMRPGNAPRRQWEDTLGDLHSQRQAGGGWEDRFRSVQQCGRKPAFIERFLGFSSAGPTLSIQNP